MSRLNEQRGSSKRTRGKGNTTSLANEHVREEREANARKILMDDGFTPKEINFIKQNIEIANMVLLKFDGEQDDPIQELAKVMVEFQRSLNPNQPVVSKIRGAILIAKPGEGLEEIVSQYVTALEKQ